jgi:mannobiose 2-epimerase
MELLEKELYEELTGNILPFWIDKMQDTENGGFWGRIDGNNVFHKEANKGAILNARILWTYSSAYRIFKNPDYLKMAERAYHYILECFLDKECGGLYWELDYLGIPVNTKKQTYVQGFALYGFSEFYRATGKPEALEMAKQFFYLIEKYAYDPVNGGYFEAFTRDWQPIEDMRLSEKDANEKKTMNTHLHVLESYTNLLRIRQDSEVKVAQQKLVRTFIDKIQDRNTNHLKLFFDENWVSKSGIISYGHDIEASWLLYEAAEVLNEPLLMEEIRQKSLEILEAALEGLQPDGSLIYESEGTHIDVERHWWVQAEAVAGLVYAYRSSGDKKYLNKAKDCWGYIQKHLIDRKSGEWYWSVGAHGNRNFSEDKAGFWKCPYHNSRMCMCLRNHGFHMFHPMANK